MVNIQPLLKKGMNDESVIIQMIIPVIVQNESLILVFISDKFDYRRIIRLLMSFLTNQEFS